jgi:actin-like ATPase involved in cell morphogenesis
MKGLDVGTMNLASAALDSAGKVKIRRMRNTFLDIEVNPFTKNMLKQHKVKYAEHQAKVYILGESAFELSNIMNKTIRRPMREGVISPDEADALPIVGLLIEAVLGKAQESGECCYYSIPADPIDADFNIIYHSSVIEGALKNLGYLPKAINEGHAVVFSELSDQDFTGIGISCGGGMFNVCVSYKTIPAISFSTSRAGDWIDKNVARVLGIKVNRATAVKEKGININKPKGREEEAVVVYYRNLISYTLTNIKNKFESAEEVPQFPQPVDIACAGGSALIGGFIEVFKEELEKIKFPIPIRDVKLAQEPLSAAAKGCLLAAISEKE